MSNELKKRIKNSWIMFRLSFYGSTKEEKINLAKQAFLWVVERFNSIIVKKEEMLDDIIGVCPQVMGVLSEKEILSAFYFFCRE